MPTSFRCAGATGQAPTTAFFGAKLPDVINMLTPMHWGTAVTYVPDALVPANFGNLWTPWNTSYDGGANVQTLSFGALATAPDGTNTAQKYVEDSSNNPHFATAGFVSAAALSPGRIRFAGFLKAGERTRAVMVHSFGTGLGATIGDSGVRWVINLAAGANGVAQASYGVSGTFKALGTQIIPYGNGWYLCIMDSFSSFLGSGNSDYRFAIYLDAGSGTAAENSTYTGNGTSGIYVWKTNALPVAAWSMNSQSFFEDFNYGSTSSPGAFDLADSRAPGFNWYLHNTWVAGYGGTSPTAASDLSVSGSILTIARSASVNQAEIMTAAWTGDSVPNTHVSSPKLQNGGFKLPAYIEAFQSLGDPPGGVGTQTIWTASIESIQAPQVADNTKNVLGHEVDIYESNLFGGNQLKATVIEYLITEGAPTISQVQTVGISRIPTYNNTYTYGAGQRVWLAGVFYQCTNVTTGNAPPNASFWSVFTGSAQQYPPIHHDYSQYHRYGYLWIPYQRSSGVAPYNTTGIFTGLVPYNDSTVGQMIAFIDGCLSDIHMPQMTYGPYEFTNSFLQNTDGNTNPIILDNTGPAAYKTDWIQVIQ